MTSWERKQVAALLSPALYAAQSGQTLFQLNDKFGRNADIDTGTTPQDVWNGGGIYTGFPEDPVATTLDIVSDNAEDNPAGTGAHRIQLIGLDADFLPQSEEINLNGLTPVTTTLTWTRMARARVLSAGSLGENAGELTAYWTGDVAQIFMVMPALKNRTAIAAFTVPGNKRGILVDWTVTASRSGSGNFAAAELRVRESGGLFESRDFVDASVASGTNNRTVNLVLPPKTDVVARIASVSNNNTTATARFSYYLIDD